MKMTRIAVLASAAVVLTAAMGSCNIYKKYETPDSTPLMAEYKRVQEQQIDSMAYGNLAWQQVFTDPVLAGLIQQALDNNTNLANARLNIDIAHAQLKGAKLSYLPSVALGPNGAGSKFFVNPHQSMSWSYQIPLSVSWEIDIFGKLLNTKRGAQAALLQSEAYHQAARSQIIAAVANTYYTLANLEAQLKLSRETAKLWAESVETMKNLKLAGRLNESAVVQSQANYYSILASITDIEVAIDQVNNTMSLLVNTPPQKWEVSPEATLVAPSMLREAIPMRELAARPDVRAAEQTLATAYYATNQARANFYPGLNITANGGFTNLIGGFITNPGDWFVQLAGSLTIPIFSRGANIAKLEATKAQQQQAMNNFEYTLMAASAEVSDAMTVYEKSAEKETYLAQQVENLEKSVEYTQELLTLGTSTYLEVLTAQQGLLGAQISQLSTQLSRSQAVINLYQSLGGGR